MNFFVVCGNIVYIRSVMKMYGCNNIVDNTMIDINKYNILVLYFSIILFSWNFSQFCSSVVKCVIGV